MLVGVISDTHGLMRPEALAALRGVELIIHAGDIGGPEVLAALRALAPVVAVRGNNDVGPWAAALPEHVDFDVAGRRVHLVHDVADARPAGADVVIAGHSHQPRNERVGGALYFNPGSAGPRRFKLPIALGRLRFGTDITAITAEIVVLVP
jgi:uncharacterized protein